MKKFEYCVLDSYASATTESVLALLNGKGAEGWRLVEVEVLVHGGHRYIFERGVK